MEERALTREDRERLAREIEEAGEDYWDFEHPVEVVVSPNLTYSFEVVLKPEEMVALDEIAEAQGRDILEAIGQAIDEYIERNQSLRKSA